MRAHGTFLHAGALLVALALVLAAPAAAAKSCWKQIQDEWTATGKVSDTYPVRCYNQSINKAPADTLNYTSFPGDVKKARAAAIARASQQQPPGSEPPTSGEEPSDPSAPAGPPGAPPVPGEGPSGSSEVDTNPVTDAIPADPFDTTGEESEGGPARGENEPPGSGGPVNEAIESLGSDGADSPPIALIILTAIAGLLAVGGAVILLARHFQGRQAGPQGPEPRQPRRPPPPPGSGDPRRPPAG